MKQILIGIFAGIFSGIGMGGGTILIFLLTIFAKMEQHIAQATNLIYFIPTAISAIIGANISVNMDVFKLKKLFGIFLAVIAIHEIYTLFKEYKQFKNRHNKNSKNN